MTSPRRPNTRPDTAAATAPGAIERRRFVGWSRAFADRVAQELLDLASRRQPASNAADPPEPGVVDLGDVLLVVPGGRLGRAVVAALVDRADAMGVVLVPPTLLTPGDLAPVLLGVRALSLASSQEPLGTSRASGAPSRPVEAIATPTHAMLAWLDALRAAPARELEPLMPRVATRGDDARASRGPGAWSAVARVLSRVSDELAGEGLLFEDVAQRAGEAMARLDAGAFPDERRWRAAAGVQRAYERRLGEVELVDEAIACVHRLRELDVRDESFTTPTMPAYQGAGRLVVLAGVAELGRAARRALTLAERLDGARVVSIVGAPPETQERFDELGCVRTDDASGACWADARLSLRDEHVVFAAGPSDQAGAALACVAHLHERHERDERDGRPVDEPLSIEQVVLGVCDAELVPVLDRVADELGSVSLRSSTGTSLAQTPPLRLLAQIGAHLRQRTFASMLALVRHPDVESMLVRGLAPGERAERWLAIMDRYHARSLHTALDDAPSGAEGEPDAPWATDDETERRVLSSVRDEIDAWLAPLAVPGAPARAPLASWAPAILTVLGACYAHRRFDRRVPAQGRVLEALACVRAALSMRTRLDAASSGASATAHQPLDNLGPRLTSVEALALVLELVGDRRAPDPPGRAQLEALGWLEVAWDDAHLAVVTGLHEGVVPASVVDDPLLPDTLRRALGIACDRSRLARDAYLLERIVRSRELVRVVVGTATSEGDPVTPSRLLFACDDAALVRRVTRWSDACAGRTETSAEPGDVGAVGRPAPLRSRLVIVPRLDVTLFPLDPARTNLTLPGEPLRLSVSDIGRYLDSPYEFYLRSVLRLRDALPPESELDALGLGTLLHEALRLFAQTPEATSDDERRVRRAMLATLDQAARASVGDRPEAPVRVQLDSARRRLSALASWQADAARQGWRIAHAEWSTPDDAPALMIVDGRPVRLVGTIDRIDRNSHTGQWRILDYKTGEKPASPDSSHRTGGRWTNVQLPMYRHLASSLGVGDAPELGYVRLPAEVAKTSWAMAPWTPDDLADADRAAREAIASALAGRFRLAGERPPSEEGTGRVPAALMGRAQLGIPAMLDPDEPDADEPGAADARAGDPRARDPGPSAARSEDRS